MEKKEPKKSQEKQRKNPLEGKNVKVVRPGDKQKTVLLTTDGRNVQINVNNVNVLEAEMMLVKSLQYFRNQPQK